jgi:hypothetical protein
MEISVKRNIFACSKTGAPSHTANSVQ